MKSIVFFISLLFFITGVNAQKKYQVQSPDKKLSVTVTTDVEGKTVWSIQHDDTQVILPSALSVEGYPTGKPDKVFHWGENTKVNKVIRQEISRTFTTPYYKKDKVEDHYNLMLLKCKGGYDIEFRVYNDGAAYRFINNLRKPFIVKNETADFNFGSNHQAFIPYVNDNRNGERYCYSFESFYDESKLSDMFADSLAITPLMVCLDKGKKAVIMDAGVINYPGLFLKKNARTPNGLVAEFAPIPLEEVIGGHARLNLIPTRRADYIAQINAPQAFPWRAVLITEQDTQLADNDMAQRLAPACRISDTSWIKPGKVAWDWWNTCNLTGVDFQAGMNTPTYKKYIDFAAANQLEYIIIDEGWSGKESMLEELNPDIDLKEVIAYGTSKNVGVILWASWRNAAKDTENVFKHYAEMGVKGFKVDFFDRDDQPLIASVEQIAEIAARHHLLLDLHGLKPNGIQRAYPNIVNFEGVKGLENAKWEPIVNGAPLHDFPRYDVTAPYLRQLIGPMDYTPGATVNATRSDFRAINDHPMSQGTRVHQMAMYTIFEAPLQMLADSPSNYEKEPDYTSFIAAVPTVFDETIALNGEVGEYITIARRKGDTWFIGAMTNWTPRTLTIDLSFLGEGSYEAVIFSDGVNAERNATDYKKETRTIKAGDKLNIRLASGGGWTARITRK